MRIPGLRQCDAFLGLVYKDGPAPTFIRYSINSGSINFTEKSWFEDPSVYRKVKKELQKKQKSLLRVTMENRIKPEVNKYNVVKLEFSKLAKAEKPQSEEKTQTPKTK